ncbi:N-acetylneuraminate lyase isoform X2 [Megachile rotundata]|uniref:N-acetylneuraminate lyase isoform X2 n=1 Tax=Megachile rotundata TaxID=143995 RepID=UPI00061534E4|nr:PREDICTED: N-acetylneuraminate lyase-like isoform X2 [Megachile rotundata]
MTVNGTTGEGPSMSVGERKLHAEAWADVVKTTKQHLMIQVGGAPLPDVLELAKHAENIKADSILCLPELYFKPSSPEQIIEYLKLVGSAAPSTPLLYYHIPVLTNVNVHMRQFLESVGEKIPTFAGIKFTSANLEEGTQALNVGNKKYAVFLGNNQTISAAYTLGIDSFISTTANMLPELVLEIMAEGKAGNMFKMREKQELLTKAVIATSKHGAWAESSKVAMPLLTNVNPGPVRAPLRVLPPQASQTMKKDFENLEFQIHE